MNMALKSAILSTAERLDSRLPPFVSQRHSETRRLVILLIHSLYRRESDPDTAGVFPHEQMTVAKLRQFVERFLEMGYTFLSPDDVLAGGRLPAKAMMLTFDDGYYNFVMVLPILREFQIPVTFFVCPGNVGRSQSFWWDAFYRRARGCGTGEKQVHRQITRMKRRSYQEICSFITERWGVNALTTVSDLDRPLSLDELKDVARDPLVHLGNHTFSHVALPFQSEADADREIRLAEEFFEREFQKTPETISYPNGDYGDSVIALCARRGYQLGMTIESRWNTIDESPEPTPLLSLGRYMLSGVRDVNRQADSVNRYYSTSAAIRRMKRHKYNRARPPLNVERGEASVAGDPALVGLSSRWWGAQHQRIIT